MALLRIVTFVALLSRAVFGGERIVESILPSLAYGAGCWSTIRMQNLGDRVVTADLEGHRAGGALVALAGHPEMTAQLPPGDRREYKLQIEEETTGAWVKIREHIPAGALSSVIAVSGVTECLIGSVLHTATREVAYPTRNPWFSTEVAEHAREIILVVNTADRAAKATVCYSSGGLYSVPDSSRPAADLRPICSGTLAVQIPPFGTFQFPLERDGNSRFLLNTTGESIALQLLRPLDDKVRIYSVDSTVTFGGEVPKY